MWERLGRVFHAAYESRIDLIDAPPEGTSSVALVQQQQQLCGTPPLSLLALVQAVLQLMYAHVPPHQLACVLAACTHACPRSGPIVEELQARVQQLQFAEAFMWEVLDYDDSNATSISVREFKVTGGGCRPSDAVPGCCPATGANSCPNNPPPCMRNS